ncbi:MAG: c-type cytochrome [Desulfuromusa sp.]
MKLVTIMIALAVCLFVVGCSKDDDKSTPAQGSAPAPKAVEKPAVVEKVEQVVEKTKEKVAQATEQVQEKVAEVTEKAKEKVAQVTTQAQGLIATALPSVSGNGQAVYTKSCASCHKIGIIGAPKTGDKAAWAPRISGGTESLVKSAINGKGKMPAKGGSSSLTDNEVKAAVEYMVEQGK